MARVMTQLMQGKKRDALHEILEILRYLGSEDKVKDLEACMEVEMKAQEAEKMLGSVKSITWLHEEAKGILEKARKTKKEAEDSAADAAANSWNEHDKIIKEANDIVSRLMVPIDRANEDIRDKEKAALQKEKELKGIEEHLQSRSIKLAEEEIKLEKRAKQLEKVIKEAEEAKKKSLESNALARKMLDSIR